LARFYVGEHKPDARTARTFPPDLPGERMFREEAASPI